MTYLSQVLSTSYELLSDSLKMHHIPHLLLYYNSVSENVRILPAAIDRYGEWSQRGIQCCGGSGPPAGKVYQRRSDIMSSSIVVGLVLVLGCMTWVYVRP